MKYYFGLIVVLLILVSASPVMAQPTLSVDQKSYYPDSIQKSTGWPVEVKYPLGQNVLISATEMRPWSSRIVWQLNGQRMMDPLKDEGVGFMGMGGSSGLRTVFIVDCTQATRPYQKTMLQYLLTQVDEYQHLKGRAHYWNVYFVTDHGLYEVQDFEWKLNPGLKRGELDRIRLRNYLKGKDFRALWSSDFRSDQRFFDDMNKIMEHQVNRVVLLTSRDRFYDPTGRVAQSLRSWLGEYSNSLKDQKRWGKEYRKLTLDWVTFDRPATPLNQALAADFHGEAIHVMEDQLQREIDWQAMRGQLVQLIERRRNVAGDYEEPADEDGVKDKIPWRTIYTLRALADEQLSYANAPQTWGLGLQWASKQSLRELDLMVLRHSLFNDYRHWLSSYRSADEHMVRWFYDHERPFSMLTVHNRKANTELTKVTIPLDEQFRAYFWMRRYGSLYRTKQDQKQADSMHNQIKQLGYKHGRLNWHRKEQQMAMTLMAIHLLAPESPEVTLKWLDSLKPDESPMDIKDSWVLADAIEQTGWILSGEHWWPKLLMDRLQERRQKGAFEVRGNAETVELALALRLMKLMDRSVGIGELITDELPKKPWRLHPSYGMKVTIPVKRLKQFKQLPPLMMVSTRVLSSLSDEQLKELQESLVSNNSRLWLHGEINDETQRAIQKMDPGYQHVDPKELPEPLLAHTGSSRFKFMKNKNTQIIIHQELLEAERVHVAFGYFTPKPMPKLKELWTEK